MGAETEENLGRFIGERTTHHNGDSQTHIGRLGSACFDLVTRSLGRGAIGIPSDWNQYDQLCLRQ